MGYQDAVEIIKNEMECVNIADVNNCNRECAVCALVMPTDRIIEAYSTAINALEKQIPKKPKGIYLTSSMCYRLGNCYCGALIHEYITFCPKCGQKLDWSDENGRAYGNDN